MLCCETGGAEEEEGKGRKSGPTPGVLQLSVNSSREVGGKEEEGAEPIANIVGLPALVASERNFAVGQSSCLVPAVHLACALQSDAQGEKHQSS